MDIASVAKKIREAVMNRAEDDGRVFHADSIEQEVAKILKAEYPTTNVWGHRVAMGPHPHTLTLSEIPSHASHPTEWR